MGAGQVISTFDTWCDDDRLASLLARAREGDVAAFTAFYDATCDFVWRLELCRSRTPAMAEAATCHRYVTAWLRAHEHAGSGLSPRAWLLSLPPSGGPAAATS